MSGRSSRCVELDDDWLVGGDIELEDVGISLGRGIGIGDKEDGVFWVVIEDSPSAIVVISGEQSGLKNHDATDAH